MSTSNRPSKSPTTSRRHPGVIIAMIPAGAILGFLGGLLIEIIVGLMARGVFSADHPAAFSWHFVGSLPGLGALIGAIVAQSCTRAAAVEDRWADALNLRASWRQGSSCQPFSAVVGPTE